MKWAVDGNNITLSKHLLEVLDTAATNLLLLLGAERLVVEVEKLLAVEWLQTAQDTLTDTANSDSTDSLALKVVLVLGNTSNIPLTLGDHLVGRDKVADKDKHSHDDVLSDGNDVGTSDFSDSDTTVGLVGSIEIDVVRTDTGGDGNLEVLRLCEALSGEVTRVEAWIG